MRTGGGIASLALADLMHGAKLSPVAPKQPHFPAKIKNVISIFCYGGVSHVLDLRRKMRLLWRHRR